MKHRKGYIQDYMFFGIIIFIVAIVILVGGKFGSDIQTHMNDSAMSTEAKVVVNDNAARFVNIFDYAFLFIFIIFMLALFVGFFMLDTHPALFFILIIVFGVMLIPIAILSNTFESFSDNSEISTTSDDFGFINYIMDHWVMMVAVFGIIGIILLIAKVRTGML